MKGERHELVNQQVIRYALELQAATERANRAGKAPAVRPVITVSRQLGSGGTAIAEALAQRLGYQLFDREIIDSVARESGVHRQIVDALDEKMRSGIEQWMDGVLHRRIFTAEEFIPALARVLITLARAGSAVIVGRGANFILAGEQALHLRVVAGREYRIGRVMRRLGAGREEAETRVHAADRERLRFIEKYLHREIDDPTAYHLILNPGELGHERTVDLVHTLYREIHGSLPR